LAGGAIVNRETRGDQLRLSAQREVLRKFVHRMTTESQRQFPEFAARMKRDGWRMQEQTDAQWLTTTYFMTNNDGSLDQRVNHCYNTHNTVSS